MYRFSLQHFVELYHKAMDTTHGDSATSSDAPATSAVAARCALVTRQVVKLTISMVLRGLFDEDRLAALLFLAQESLTQTQPGNAFSKEEWGVLVGIEGGAGKGPPPPGWLP